VAKKISKKPETLTTFHRATENGRLNVVAIGNLRVAITYEGDDWFAQGLEIDYGVPGKSLEDVKVRFEDGLAWTIHENLTVWGNINRLLKPAPPEIWMKFFEGAGVMRKGYSQVSFHKLASVSVPARIKDVLPFEAIDYFQRQSLATSGAVILG